VAGLVLQTPSLFTEVKGEMGAEVQRGLRASRSPETKRVKALRSVVSLWHLARMSDDALKDSQNEGSSEHARACAAFDAGYAFVLHRLG